MKRVLIYEVALQNSVLNQLTINISKNISRKFDMEIVGDLKILKFKMKT